MQYSSARIKNPDRIFFDIHDARLPAEVAKANVKVEGNLVTSVRAAQNHAGIVRVVLDVNGVKEYNASLQDNPPALIIDLYAKSGAVPQTAKGKKPVNAPVVDAKGEAELADVLPAVIGPWHLIPQQVGSLIGVGFAGQLFGALHIVDTQADSVVVPEIELRDIPFQVRRADVLIGAVDSALQNREVIFDGVRVPEVSADIFLG